MSVYHVLVDMYLSAMYSTYVLWDLSDSKHIQQNGSDTIDLKVLYSTVDEHSSLSFPCVQENWAVVA